MEGRGWWGSEGGGDNCSIKGEELAPALKGTATTFAVDYFAHSLESSSVTAEVLIVKQFIKYHSCSVTQQDKFGLVDCGC